VTVTIIVNVDSKPCSTVSTGTLQSVRSLMAILHAMLATPNTLLWAASPKVAPPACTSTICNFWHTLL